MKMDFHKIGLIFAALVLAAGCASTPSESSSASGGSDSEFSDFDKSGSSDAVADSGGEDSLEKELSESGSEAQQPQAVAEAGNLDQAQPTEKGGDEFAEFEQAQAKQTQPEEVAPEPQAAPAEMAQAEPPPPEIQPEPAPPIAEQTPVAPPAVEEPTPVTPPAAVETASVEKPVVIQRLQFKGNDGGGTLSIDADGPLTFTTRTNEKTNQFIIEIPNSTLSRKAKRSLNTKDFPGGIGSIDPYQARGSKTSRIVIQMRAGASEPVVQAEGNSLLVVANQAQAPVAAAEPVVDEEEKQETAVQAKILSGASLEEFLSGNQQFYGKKISIEVNDAELRDVFKFISDESGVNLVLGEDVKGKVSIKLKQVPWDQALVVIMRAKKLGYSRQGQILRIAKIQDLRQEEDDYTRLAKAKQSALPLTVKMIPVSYAKVDELVKQVTPFLSDRGRAIAEARTSAIVVSDNQESINRIQKLVQSLDIAPAQVLIEGKVVEARETFQRFIGVNWGTSGDSIGVGSNSKGGKINLGTGPFSISPESSTTSAANFKFSLGTLDFLGDLTASLGLGEKSGEVKVLSSPRILTLHNEPAEISQVSEIPLIQTTSTNGSSATNVTFKPVKLRLSVTPQVTNDASVIMSVDVNREFAGEVVDKQTQARPVNTRAAKTKVIVRNGQTAVIGGIYQSDATESTSGVPGLSSIPVLGWLFKSESTDRQKNELLIFLTPRIVGQADSGISTPPPPLNSSGSEGSEPTSNPEKTESSSGELEL